VATLNKAKKETLIFLQWAGIILFALIFLFIGAKFYSLVKTMFLPPPAPEAKFGKLSRIPFPSQAKENITYSLDTLSGSLPNFPDRTKVYEITPDSPTLLGLDKTREKVAKIGFASLGTQISEDTYQWVDSNSLQKRLTINIFSSDFSLSSPYLVTQSMQTFLNSDEQNQTQNIAKTFISSLTTFPQDIDEEKTKTTFYSIEGSVLVPTSKIANAKIVRVDFFQKDLDKMPIYYNHGIFSNIDLLIGKESNQLQVVEAHFFHKNISETFSTYSIKTAQEAYSELQKGKAYIANKPVDSVEFTIKKVFLGYYLGEDNQKYLMPVVVFEGNNDFVAYVSAIKDEWINN
jgi:hypothetical protein